MIESATEYPCTSLYRVPAVAASDVESVLVFIPGNPGLVEFYTTFLNLIQQRFPQLEILCVSHAGYNTSREAMKNKFQFYDIEYQVNHKYRVIRDLVKSKGHVDLYIMSHSFGSYLVPRVISKLIDDPEMEGCFKVKFVGNICPTLTDIALSDSGVSFTRLFSLFPLVQFAVFIASFLGLILSEAFSRRIIRAKIVDRPKEEDVVSLEAWENSVTGCYHLFRNTNIVRHSLQLARRELEEIGEKTHVYDWFFEHFPRDHGCHIWNFYAEKDYWVHDSSRDALIKKYFKESNKHVVFTIDRTGITHSFCVNQSVELATIVNEWIGQKFPHLDGGDTNMAKAPEAGKTLRNRR